MSAQQDSPAATAREARDHPALDRAARAGMFAYGVLYVVVAWLAVQLAMRDGSGSASGEGALREVSQQPLGGLALWMSAAGFAALALWQVCQAVGGHRSEDGLRRWASRAGSAGRGAVFATLAVLSIRTATGGSGSGGSGGSGGPRGVTVELMAQPFGPALVIGVGVGVAVMGANSIHKAVTDRWRKGLDADGRSGTVAGPLAVLARTGYVGRAIAFLTLAGLFVWAGVTHDAGKSGGLDQAIVRFRDEPYGTWLILLVAAGLACYGAFHVARAFFLRAS